MSERNIALIIGAGATIPFGMPSGIELLENAKSYNKDKSSPLSGDSIFKHFASYSAFRTANIDKHIQEFESRLTNNRLLSIDSFLTRQSLEPAKNQKKLNEAMGKFIIADLILDRSTDAIKNTRRHFWTTRGIFREKRNNSGNWISIFCDKLSSANAEEFIENLKKIKIISFNYDRLLEQSLIEHFFSTFPEVKHNDALIRDFVDEIESIIYVYGSVGEIVPPKESENFFDINKNLPKITGSDSDMTHHPYNQELTNFHQRLIASNEIKIMREEQLHEGEELLIGIKKIFVLGFAYHPLNVKKLGLFNKDPKFNRNKRILYSTTLGLSNEKINKIADDGGFWDYRDDEQKVTSKDRAFFDNSESANQKIISRLIL